MSDRKKRREKHGGGDSVPATEIGAATLDNVSAELGADVERTVEEINRRVASEAIRLNGPTPASAWRRPAEEIVTVALPSGNAATIRKPSLAEMIAGGAIPDGLSDAVARILAAADGSQGLSVDARRKVFTDPANISAMAGLTGAICRAVFVQPRIVDEGKTPEGDEEIALDWLTFEDRMFVFSRVTQGAEDMLPFPEEPGAGGDPALGGEDVPVPAEPHPPG